MVTEPKKLVVTIAAGLDLYGPPERIRTSDLCLRRAALYPAELRAVYGELLAVSGCIVYGFLLSLYSLQRREDATQIRAAVLMCA